MTAVANSVFTAAQFNTHVRDNLNETAPAKATAAGQIFVATGANAIAARTPTGATVATSESTASTSYTDLATSGPAVTVTTGASALVMVGARSTNTTTSTENFMSYAVSGATTDAAADARALIWYATSSAPNLRAMAANLHTGLTPGSNTFTAKYKVGSGTGSWFNRHLIVIPL